MVVASEFAHSHLRRWTREEYDRLVAQGAFEGERIELLHGMLVKMAPEGAEHSDTIMQLIRWAAHHFTDHAGVRVQNPLIAADDSEPEPDLAIVPGLRYPTEHPREAHLVVEVARSSLVQDRTLKAGLYARSRFEEYWIVDLRTRCVEVYRGPEDGRYTSLQTCRPGDSVAPLAFPEATLDVGTLFPS